MGLRDLLGDSEVCHQLEGLINSHRLPHAVVLEGRDIQLSKKVAAELASACMCTGSGEHPCGQCSNCVKVKGGIHPDVYTVNIVDKKQAIGVGEIRTMISDCYIKPNEAPCKVYFICDKMTSEAQNALLKILEEPPANVQFIIVTESSATLLQTILSRSTVFKTSGTMRVVSGNNDSKVEELAVEIAEAIPKNVELPLLIAANKLTTDKSAALRVFDRLSEILSTALEEKYLKTNSVPPYAFEISRTLRKRSIVRLLEVTSQARTMLTQNCNMNLLVTWFCANIRQSRHSD